MKDIFRLVAHSGFLFTLYWVFTISEPLQAQWIETNGPGSPVGSLIVHGTELYAGTTKDRGTGGVYLSTLSNRTNWIPVNEGLANLNVTGLGVYNSVLFAGTLGWDLYRYEGGIWDTVLFFGTGTIAKCFVSQNTMVFTGTAPQGVYRSSNGGVNWTKVNTGLPTYPSVWGFVLNGNSLFAATDSGIYCSTNYGTDWIRKSNGLLNQNVYALALVDTILIASVPTSEPLSIYRSTNNGANWVRVALQRQPPILKFAVTGRNIFGAASTGGVYLSTDLGTTWSTVNTGLPFGLPILSIAICADTLYAGSSYSATINGLVYYRPISEMITDVHEIRRGPTEFELEQNYPNPFNPSTTINYQIATPSHVVLRVFDVLGREVSNLVNDIQEPGYKSVQWDASNFTSGLYLYQLRAGSFIKTRKMLLVK